MTLEACIDILLATYNGSKFIEEQLNSILNQTHQNFHLIISDGGSTDHTMQILQNFASRYPSITILPETKAKRGVIDNFSYLMSYAKSDYIMFSDQDDVWKKNKVEKTFTKMKELENKFTAKAPILVHTDLVVVNEDLKYLHSSFWKYSKLNPTLNRAKVHQLNRLLTQNVVTGCTMMINRSLSELAMPIPVQAVMHDWWLALVASAFGEIDIVECSTMLYRQHTLNAVGAKKFWSLANLKKGLKKIKNQDQDLKKINQVQELLLRYDTKLSFFQKKMLKDYLKCSNSFFHKRMALIIRHQFLKNGLVRNLVNICLSKNP